MDRTPSQSFLQTKFHSPRAVRGQPSSLLAINDVGGLYDITSPSTPLSNPQENGASFDTPSKSPSMPPDSIDITPKPLDALLNDDEIYRTTSSCTGFDDNSSFANTPPTLLATLIEALVNDNTIYHPTSPCTMSSCTSFDDNSSSGNTPPTPLATLWAQALLNEHRKTRLTDSKNAELPLPCSYQSQDFDLSFDSQTLVVSLSPKLQCHFEIGRGDRARAYEFFYVMGQLHKFLFDFERFGMDTLFEEVYSYIVDARNALQNWTKEDGSPEIQKFLWIAYHFHRKLCLFSEPMRGVGGTRGFIRGILTGLVYFPDQKCVAVTFDRWHTTTISLQGTIKIELL